MTMPRCIRVWLGGSFDPIHLAHLQMIAHVYHELMHAFPNVDIVAKLLPTAGSPLKTKPTSNQQRLEMLALAIGDVPFLSIDETELQCQPPVYSFHTLSEFKQCYPNDLLIFVLGQDSVEQLDKWYRGFDLLSLTNLWVLPRPALGSLSHNLSQTLHQNALATKDKPPSINIDNRLVPFIIHSPKDLINQTTNHIYIDKFVVPDIASRDIRAWLYSTEARQRQQARLSLPSQVYRYIVEHQLYAPDV
ncbi:nicotinate (nicotinamide) nucleotide adenylyltransferase [Moraxella sp. CTOTU49803]|uniref:nicotinate (nicotinamide) nucleotide adenylyltransferase n=1 Tax=Moraxella sp. CTOTU49803 TaxID=2953840 RepID=UPI0028AF851E|nr:nicotinate (nicotinamide) nucleotide adenylyltransferase [Moraxella sp. CTOTU49803]